MGEHSHTSWLHTSLSIGFLGLILIMNAAGQERGIVQGNGAKQIEKTDNEQTIRVGVEEILLDAIVVDQRGHQIKDLTTGDFEIYQDGQPQKITASTYIRETQPAPEKMIAASAASQASPKAPPVPTPTLTREAVRRTIVFLVDDLSMNFPDLHNARISLEKFVETQKQPGDLVSIMQTKGGSAGLQTFTSDNKQLLARISSIRWSTNSHPSGISYFSGLLYCLRALQDMPGRKFILLLSPDVVEPARSNIDSAFNGLADAAWRAGVVIHTLDIVGGINNQATATVLFNGDVLYGTMDAEIRQTLAQQRRAEAKMRTENREIPLSKKTGGLFLTGNNFFVNGIGSIEEQMKGYYLLSYAPPANTFNSDNSNKPDYHQLEVKVKRAGCEVHSRDGFYGRSENLIEPQASGNSLEDAISSPFRYNGLTLNLASGYIDDPQKGYLVRAWVQLDGSNLSFKAEKDGGHSVSLLAIARTSDITGLVQDSGETRIGFPVSVKDIQWVRENGLRLSLSLPAKKPGSFYVHVAVKDEASGAIGSAYQYLEIPDLKKDGLSLSSIFILNRGDDVSWIESGATEGSDGQANSSRQPARRSQAFRRYLPGESFNYMAIIYNAATRDGVKPDLESRFVLFKNGEEIFESKPESVDLSGLKDFTRIPIKKTLKLENTMPPGDYVLQLFVMDKRKQEKMLASQILDFQIALKSFNTAVQQTPFQYDEDSVEAKGKTVIEMTSNELRHSFPNQLTSLKFSQSQDNLNDLLDKTGATVVAFFRDLSNTVSKERIAMSRYHKQGKEIIPSHFGFDWVEEYQYLILTGSGNSEASWKEDRTDKKNNPVDQKEIPGFIVTSGYAAYCLYFHPNHQANSNFRYLGRDKSGAHIIAFAQKPESRDYLAKLYSSWELSTIRFLVQGFVWVDPDSYQILRMYTRMLLPERKTLLEGTTTDISYEKVRFDNNASREFWLPKEVYVDWDVPDYRYINRHKYSDYRSFTVETDYKIDQPKVNK